jgi:hypothetical protein
MKKLRTEIGYDEFESHAKRQCQESDKSAPSTRVPHYLEKLPKKAPTLMVFRLSNWRELFKFFGQGDFVNKLKFVLTPDMTLLFAPEGDGIHLGLYPIASHAQMVGLNSLDQSNCLAAGHIYLNNDHRIIALDNISAGFNTTTDSMMSVLGVLAAHTDQIAFDESISFIVKRDDNSLNRFTKTFESIKEECSALLNSWSLRKSNLATDVIQYQYRHRSPFFAQAIKPEDQQLSAAIAQIQNLDFEDTVQTAALPDFVMSDAALSSSQNKSAATRKLDFSDEAMKIFNGF